MLKPDRFSCSQKIWLKRDPPVCTITQGQLTALSQAAAWDDMEKPHQDMAFLLIAPSLAIGCKWVFGLTTVWTHPHQAHLPMLVEATQKLLLLADGGASWSYAYIRMNDTMAHMLLSSVGHIGVMTDDLPSQNTCGCLHQICMWQLFQCRGHMVCLDGLNGGLEPLMFNFKELPLWNMAESSKDPSMMDVDLGNMICAASSTTQTEDPLSLTSRGTVEQFPPISLAASSQHSTPRRKPQSAALGAPPSTNVGDPLSLKGTDPATSDATANSP